MANGDAVIDSNDVFHILKQIVGSQLNDEKLLSVIKQTMEDLDSDDDGLITFE